MTGRLLRRFMLLTVMVVVFFLHYGIARATHGGFATFILLWPFGICCAFLSIVRLPTAEFRSLRLSGVLLGTVLLAVPSFFFLPLTSNDGYASLVAGDVVVHGGRPYAVSAIADVDSVFARPLHGDPVYKAPSPYGPAWLGLASLSVRLFGEHLELNLLFLRLALLCALLVAEIAVFSALKDAPAWREKATTLLGWNPLVIFATILDLHHDALLVLCFALAFVCWKRSYLWAAVVSMVIAGFVRWFPFLLIPYLGILLFQRTKFKGRLVAQSFTYGAVVLGTLIFILRFFGGSIAVVHSMMKQAQSVNTSFFGTQAALFLTPSSSQNVAGLLQGGSGVSHAAQSAVRFLGYGMFLVLYGRTMFDVIRKRTLFPHAALAVVVGCILFATQWFQPWYCVWLLPFAMLEEGLGVAVTLVTIALFVGYWFSTLGAVLVMLVVGLCLYLFRYVPLRIRSNVTAA